jgi:hypothetical protein
LQGASGVGFGIGGAVNLAHTVDPSCIVGFDNRLFPNRDPRKGFFGRQFLVKRRTPAHGVFESKAGGPVDLDRLEYRIGRGRVGSVGRDGDSSGRSQRGSS